MVFTSADRILIQELRKTKGFGARRFMTEFPGKTWSLAGLSRLIKKIDSTGTAERKVGSGRKRTARNETNVEAVEDLVLSQEEKPRTHKSIRQISAATGIKKSSVHNIIQKDLNLKCFKKKRAQQLTERDRGSRLIRCKRLLKEIPQHQVPFLWFTDEKIFKAAEPINPQNDRVYAQRGTLKKSISSKRLLHTRPTFSKSVMVSVGVSLLGSTELIFVDPGVKINGEYYRDCTDRALL